MIRITENPGEVQEMLKSIVAKFEKIIKEILEIKNGKLAIKVKTSRVPDYISLLSKQEVGIIDDLLLLNPMLNSLSKLNDGLKCSISSTIKREIELHDEYREAIKNFIRIFIAVTDKYRCTAAEYYNIIIQNGFKKHGLHEQSLFYFENQVYRFLQNGILIAIPMQELLEIHLSRREHEKVGSITLLERDKPLIYFERNIKRRDLRKDYYCDIELCIFNSDTLQINLIETKTEK